MTGCILAVGTGRATAPHSSVLVLVPAPTPGGHWSPIARVLPFLGGHGIGIQQHGAFSYRLLPLGYMRPSVLYSIFFKAQP